MIINGFTPNESVFNTKFNNEENKSNNFNNVLQDSLDKLNDKQVKADNITNDFILGKDVEIQDVMMSTEEAKLSLQLAVQVRNKVIEAVQELTRMQL